MNDQEIKAQNFDNLMKDFEAYVAPIARSKGWSTWYSDMNWIPPTGEAPDYNGHNPFQVLICLATDSKDWKDVCAKTGHIAVEAFGKMTNI
jgi:hypothetical protein